MSDRLTQTPPLGWNSFDCFGCLARAQDLHANLDTFVERLMPHGYEYFVLDGGWYRQYDLEPGENYPTGKGASITLDAYGRPSPAPWAFPAGLAPIIEATHAAGVKFGIHMMRGIARKAVEENLPVEGTDYTARDIANTDDTCSWCADNYGINMDHPGGQAWYDGTIAMLTSWGVDYIKYDDIVPKPREVEAVANAIEKLDRDIVLSLSPGNGHQFDAKAIYRRADCMRVSGDVWDDRVYFIWDFERWEKFLPYVQGEERGFWLDLDMIPFGHLKLCNPHRQNDPEEDLNFGKGQERMSNLNPPQKRTFITIRALSASPLFMGGDLPSSDEESFALITDPGVLACNQNGVAGQPVERGEAIELWRTSHRDDPKQGWVGVFNRSESDALPLELTAERLNIPTTSSLCSLWEKKDLGPVSAKPSVTIEPDDVLFLEYQPA